VSKPLVSSTTPTGQIVNNDGTATYAFIKWMQSVGSTVNVAFDSGGIFQGPIGAQATIDGRSTLATIVQNIDITGVIEANGIDFIRAYLHKDTDHIADGTGSPLAGGKAAQIALITTPPVPEAHKWVNGFVAGVFTKSQPAYSDLTGPIQFETNTVNNSSQTKLNLKQGSNVTITDGGSGNITISASTTTTSAYVVRFTSVDYHAHANEAVFCNTGGVFGLIVTLPAAASNAGAIIIVKKISTDLNNKVTIAPTGGDLIDGATSQLLALPYASSQFVSDGISNWWAV
jgi:hypothetical protein